MVSSIRGDNRYSALPWALSLHVHESLHARRCLLVGGHIEPCLASLSCLLALSTKACMLGASLSETTASVFSCAWFWTARDGVLFKKVLHISSSCAVSHLSVWHILGLFCLCQLWGAFLWPPVCVVCALSCRGLGFSPHPRTTPHTYALQVCVPVLLECICKTGQNMFSFEACTALFHDTCMLMPGECAWVVAARVSGTQNFLYLWYFIHVL